MFRGRGRGRNSDSGQYSDRPRSSDNDFGRQRDTSSNRRSSRQAVEKIPIYKFGDFGSPSQLPSERREHPRSSGGVGGDYRNSPSRASVKISQLKVWDDGMNPIENQNRGIGNTQTFNGHPPDRLLRSPGFPRRPLYQEAQGSSPRSPRRNHNYGVDYNPFLHTSQRDRNNTCSGSPKGGRMSSSTSTSSSSPYARSPILTSNAQQIVSFVKPPPVPDQECYFIDRNSILKSEADNPWIQAIQEQRPQSNQQPEPHAEGYETFKKLNLRSNSRSPSKRYGPPDEKEPFADNNLRPERRSSSRSPTKRYGPPDEKEPFVDNNLRPERRSSSRSPTKRYEPQDDEESFDNKYRRALNMEKRKQGSPKRNRTLADQDPLCEQQNLFKKKATELGMEYSFKIDTKEFNGMERSCLILEIMDKFGHRFEVKGMYTWPLLALEEGFEGALQKIEHEYDEKGQRLQSDGRRPFSRGNYGNQRNLRGNFYGGRRRGRGNNNFY